MSDEFKTIQEALVEVQRKVNEERITRAKTEWENIEEGTALVPYSAVKQTDWKTVSKPVAAAAPSAFSKVGGALKSVGRIAGPVGVGASIGATASDILGAASKTETGKSVGKWIGQNVPGAKTAADAMKKAGEAIGVREPSSTISTQTPASSTTKTANVPTPPARPSQTELNKMSRDTGLKDSGSKYAAGKPHSVTDLKVTQPGQQSKVQSKTTEKGWADPGRWENEAKSKTGSMQQIRGGKVLPPSSQLGTPKDEKSTQSFLDKELGRSSTTPSSTPQTPQQRWDAAKQATGVSDTTTKAQTTAVQSRPAGETSTSNFLKSQGVGVSTEDGGKKKKMSEETNPLIAAFMKLQSENPQNMFEAAKKLSPKQEKIAKLAGDKSAIDAADLAALRAGKHKMEEGNIDPVVTGSKTVTSSPKGYVDPSTPTQPYTKAPVSTAAGDVLDKAKNALDKTGVKEEAEVTFSQAEIDHLNSFFLEASVAPNRPEVAIGADSTSDKMSQNDVTGTSTESGGKKKAVKEEIDLDETSKPEVSVYDNAAHVKDKMGKVVASYSKKEHGADYMKKANAHMSKIKEETDAADETNMAKTQLKAMASKAKNLHSKLKTSKNLPAWVQSKLAVAKDGVTSVDDYMTHKEETLEEGRPKKNPTPETTERDPRKHIQVEAGRAAAGNVIDFHHNDGSKSKITPPMGRKIVAHLQGLKPADRQAAVNKMHDSPEGLKI